MDKILIICGPTASGKSALSLNLAALLPTAEIINGDVLQCYKKIPIISAQPDLSNVTIAHHLYSFLDVTENFSVAKWLDKIVPLTKDILAKQHTPIIVGGSGMYLNSLIKGLKKTPDIPAEISEQTNQLVTQKGLTYLYQQLCAIDPNTTELLNNTDPTRIIRAYNLYQTAKLTPSAYQKLDNHQFFPKDRFIICYLKPEREQLYENCNQRFAEMLENGLLDEVKYLNNYPNAAAHKAIGYKEFSAYLAGENSYAEALELAKQNTRRYAKRQMTWFNNQLDAEFNLIKATNPDDIIKELQKLC